MTSIRLLLRLPESDPLPDQDRVEDGIPSRGGTGLIVGPDRDSPGRVPMGVTPSCSGVQLILGRAIWEFSRN